MIDFCNLSEECVSHHGEEMSKKWNDSFHGEAQKTGKHLFQYLHPSLSPDLNGGLKL